MAKSDDARTAASYCAQCGQMLVPINRFCPRCGTGRSSDAQSAVAPAAVALPLKPDPRASTRTKRAVLLIAVVVALALLAVQLYGRDLLGSLTGAVTPSCSVGLTGAAVSVTAQGLNAQSQCDAFLQTTTDGGNWYLYSGGQTPTGAAICQVTYLGTLITVRDQGLANIYGSGICRNLIDLAKSAAVTSAPATGTIPPTEVGQPTPNLDWISGPFVADPNGDLVLEQERTYLMDLLKPCPRAGCEDATPEPELLWLFIPNAAIPEEFIPCLNDPQSCR